MEKRHAPHRKSSRPTGKKKFPNKRFKKNNRKSHISPKVKFLAREHGLGMYDALAVHKKKITLEQALINKQEKEERKKVAMEICSKHPNIELPLACHLVKENLSVEEYFERKKQIEIKKVQKEQQKKEKMQKDMSQEKAFAKLSQYVEKKTSLVIEKYKNKEKTVQIRDFTPYEFSIKHPYKEVYDKIHRLEIKYMYSKNIQKTVKKFIMFDKSLQKKRLKPTHGKEGRFRFSENDLNEGNEVMLALHEGEMLRGKIIWSTPYDIMLNLANNKIWVFRHAVNDCMVLKRST